MPQHPAPAPLQSALAVMAVVVACACSGVARDSLGWMCRRFDMGHLDFTLALDDGPITHVLHQITTPLPARFARLDRHTPTPVDARVPSAEAAKKYPFLFSYSKLDDALAGLDAMAKEAAAMAASDVADNAKQAASPPSDK